MSAVFREVLTGSEPALAAAMGQDGDLVEVRLRRGCRCFAAWLEGGLVAYGWLADRPEWIGEVGLELRPGAGEAYIWNCVTLAPHRRRGLFAALVVFITGQMRREGLSRLWIATVEGTAESAVRHAGFTPVLGLSARSLGGVRWLRLRPAPGAPPGLVAAGRRVLSARSSTVLRRHRVRRH